MPNSLQEQVKSKVKAKPNPAQPVSVLSKLSWDHPASAPI